MLGPNTNAEITLLPVTPSDFYALAVLECKTFWDSNFSVLAFGPQRSSEARLQRIAKDLAKASEEGHRIRHVKAVKGNGNGEEEIVGWAAWEFVTGRKEGDPWRAEREVPEGEDNPFGPGANVEFCEDVFHAADKQMEKACKERDYAKLGLLVVSPKCQRRGVGTMLLAEGLKEVDASGLQCVLGASPEGRNLYKRFGFEDFSIKVLHMSRFEGGEGMEDDEHVVMHRALLKMMD